MMVPYVYYMNSEPELEQTRCKNSITSYDMAKQRLQFAAFDATLTIQPTMDEALDIELDRWHSIPKPKVLLDNYWFSHCGDFCKYQKFGSHITIKDINLEMVTPNEQKVLKELLRKNESFVCVIDFKVNVLGFIAAIRDISAGVSIEFKGEYLGYVG